MLLTAGVSVPVELLEYFERLGMTLTEAFGMSENTGGVTINPQQRVKLGSAGRPYPGTYVKIDNPDSHGNGEVSIDVSGIHSLSTKKCPHKCSRKEVMVCL